MSDKYVVLTMLVAALVTAGLRFAPFLIFRNASQTPKLVTDLGNVLPFAIMGMLVVYCLKDVSLTHSPFGIPEALGCIIVALLHIWKRNTLLSIGVGTVCYMLMIQFLF